MKYRAPKKNRKYKRERNTQDKDKNYSKDLIRISKGE